MTDEQQQYIVTFYRDATVIYTAIFTASDAKGARDAAESAWKTDDPKVTWVEDGLSEHDSGDVEDLVDIQPADEDEVAEHLQMVENEKNPPRVGFDHGELALLVTGLELLKLHRPNHHTALVEATVQRLIKLASRA